MPGVCPEAEMQLESSSVTNDFELIHKHQFWKEQKTILCETNMWHAGPENLQDFEKKKDRKKKKKKHLGVIKRVCADLCVP